MDTLHLLPVSNFLVPCILCLHRIHKNLKGCVSKDHIVSLQPKQQGALASTAAMFVGSLSTQVHTCCSQFSIPCNSTVSNGQLHLFPFVYHVFLFISPFQDETVWCWTYVAAWWGFWVCLDWQAAVAGMAQQLQVVRRYVHVCDHASRDS